MTKADPHIGLLHRGTEKLIEYKTYMQVSRRNEDFKLKLLRSVHTSFSAGSALFRPSGLREHDVQRAGLQPRRGEAPQHRRPAAGQVHQVLGVCIYI